MKHIFPFCGRKKELKELQTALTMGKNVVVNGSYGIGKTRLALEVVKNLSGCEMRLDLKESPSLLRKRFLRQEKIHKQDSRLKLVVLDNIFRLSAQKAEFLRYLSVKDISRLRFYDF